MLEHVPDPLALVKHVAGFVKPSGHLYIEVPQDLKDAEIAQLKNGHSRPGLAVHEHINVYCAQSIRSLIEAAGLELISVSPPMLTLAGLLVRMSRAMQKAGVGDPCHRVPFRVHAKLFGGE